MRARKGKQVGDIVVLPRTSSASINQMRCPKCSGLAVALAGNPKDKNTTYSCGQCGSKFSSRQF
jgi:DNA-directed RNA polymerase subunit RPC12/RpoP